MPRQVKRSQTPGRMETSEAEQGDQPRRALGAWEQVGRPVPVQLGQGLRAEGAPVLQAQVLASSLLPTVGPQAALPLWAWFPPLPSEEPGHSPWGSSAGLTLTFLL